MRHTTEHEHTPTTQEEAVHFLFDALEYLERRGTDFYAVWPWETEELLEIAELFLADHIAAIAFPHPGHHLHKCDHCQTTWEHQDECMNPLAHTCPGCGEEQYEKYFGTDQHTHVGKCHFLAGVAQPLLNLTITPTKGVA